MSAFKTLRSTSLSLLLVLTLPTAALGQDAARLDEVVQAYVPDRFMGSVLVVRDDEVVLDKSYGSANLEWNIPNTPETKFRLGSITKQFTAAAILLLEEQGKLKTSDLLSVHLPNTPEAWKDITIHHLLSHEAGLQNFTSLPWYAENMMKPFTAQATIDVFRDLPLDFAPGSEFRYSNSGFIVLGRLVELVGGVSYADFLRDNIFTPLGMTNSGYDSTTQVIANRASGYTSGPNGPVNAGYVDMSVPHGAGALYSTTGDLLRWNQGLFGGELLSAESLAKMTTPNLGDYAYGVIVTTTHDAKKVAHNGGIQGFNTSMAYYPDEKLLVVALSNINGPGADSIVANLDNIMHGETVVLPAERQEISLTDDILQRYVGTYPLTPNFAISVTVEGGQLITQATNQGKLPIFAETETKFFAKAVEATIEFQKDATGAVTGLTLNQNGRSMPAPKQALIPPPATPEEISVSEAILAKYVGSYALRPNFILTVTLENGQLMTQATGQQKLPVYAETETKFFLKVVPASIEFQLDAAGAVTGLVLNQGGRSMPAPRQ
jgi:CubicO group peptidase (beta-lactamase class C family)